MLLTHNEHAAYPGNGNLNSKIAYKFIFIGYIKQAIFKPEIKNIPL